MVLGGGQIERQLRLLLDRFLEVHGVQGVLPIPLNFQFETGPHTRPAPLRDERGIYLFFRDNEWLRIGQTGYSQRFTSQHYGTRRAGSTFAADLWNNREHFGFEGDEARIDAWILENFGRANIRIPARDGDAMSRLLEAFLHLNLRPRFEGRR